MDTGISQYLIIFTQISTSPSSNWNQVSGGNEETDNVFVDERNIEETDVNTEEGDAREHVAAKDPLVAPNPWKEDVKGIYHNLLSSFDWR
jgi:hypothetical protein